MHRKTFRAAAALRCIDKKYLLLYFYLIDKEEVVLLKHMSETLDKILKILSRPQNIMVRIFDIGAAIVTILGILTIIDLIRSWIGG